MYKIKIFFKYILLFFVFPKKKRKIVNLYSDEEIIYLIKKGYSMGRYGDGELSLIFGKNIGFQNKNSKLSDELRMVLENYNSGEVNKYIVGVPKAFNNCDNYTLETSVYWAWYLYRNFKQITKIVKNIKYGNASITRPYIDYKKTNYYYFEKNFNLLKQIWDNKEIIIVEGEFSCLGVGNDLFANAKSIKRIICPKTNAFKKYDKIYSSILNNYNGELILFALGPTATVLTYSLSQKEHIQCIDIGHIDIEYMWYLNKANKKSSIVGKYVNESSNNNYESNKKDEVYLSQIIDTIK